ncbi:MAG: endo-1,4-beta-xylanase [Bacteroidales bacterium]
MEMTGKDLKLSVKDMLAIILVVLAVFLLPQIRVNAQEARGLKEIKSQMLMGACVSDGSKTFFNNASVKSIVLKNCEVATIQCYPAWGRWDETYRHVYHLDDFHTKVVEMKKQGIPVTAHMLMGWDQYFPNWYRNNDFPADTLDAILNSWIRSIILHKGNDTLVDTWNVVNEAISWNGQGGYWPLYNADLKSACEMQRLGYEPDSSGLTGTQRVNATHPLYIRRSFEIARQYTNSKLELRDASIEFPTDSKYKAFYQLAMHLKKMKAPVEVIGFQAHLNLEQQYDWDGFANNIRRYRQLGYEVNINEVDVGDPTKTWTTEKADLQKMMYYRLVTASIKGGAAEFHTWGIQDDNNTGWRHGEKGLFVTSTFSAKPAFYGMREALIDMSQILFWEMEAMKADTMQDVMNYGNYGLATNMETPVIAAGFRNKALQFDGVDDMLVSKPLSDSLKNDLTFSCFFKTLATGSVLASIHGETLPGLQLAINQEGKLTLAGEALTSTLMSRDTVHDGLWHFAAVKCDSSSCTLYLDRSQATDSCERTQQTYTQLTLGAARDGSSYFNGIIDEVKLYDTYIENASFTRSMLPFCPLKPAIQQNKMIMKLTWADQSVNEEGYVIERKTGSGNWEEIKTIGKFLSYTDTVNLYSTVYAYRIRSMNRFGKSEPSLSVSATSPMDPHTGILPADQEERGSSVYPNPFTGTFTITNKVPAAVGIYDSNGRLVFENHELKPTLEVPGERFAPGVYILRTLAGKATYETVIIRQ